MAARQSKTEVALEQRMREHAGDDERVTLLARARSFKRTWLELAEALARAFERQSWRRWGFSSFESYCRQELSITPATAQKLLGSFRFLRDSEPQVLTRVKAEPSAPVPSLKAVDFVARAAERGAADADAMAAIRHAAFDEGDSERRLARRFREVAFPVSATERRDQATTQLSQTARRLAHLIADADAPIPHNVAVAVEEAIGQLLACLENAGG
ncbi:MAG TPA: hypothetical protein VFG83_18495 [Kofleriaceae bacterium]|nr:hypothetical protein [Kofleriaceae bacterium]